MGGAAALCLPVPLLGWISSFLRRAILLGDASIAGRALLLTTLLLLLSSKVLLFVVLYKVTERPHFVLFI